MQYMAFSPPLGGHDAWLPVPPSQLGTSSDIAGNVDEIPLAPFVSIGSRAELLKSMNISKVSEQLLDKVCYFIRELSLY